MCRAIKLDRKLFLQQKGYLPLNSTGICTKMITFSDDMETVLFHFPAFYQGRGGGSTAQWSGGHPIAVELLFSIEVLVPNVLGPTTK